MNPAVLRQQMGHSSAVMTARYTGEIPLDKVQEAFSRMELENMEVIGNRSCTGSRLVVYNQQTRGTERASYNGSIEASQASDVGSIPIARSNKINYLTTA